MLNGPQVSCGVYHTLALTESGNLYGWGYNFYGQLMGDKTTVLTATKLDLGERM